VVVTNKAWDRFGVANAVFEVACRPRSSPVFGRRSRAAGRRKVGERVTKGASTLDLRRAQFESALRETGEHIDQEGLPDTETRSVREDRYEGIATRGSALFVSFYGRFTTPAWNLGFNRLKQ
jgi:hypothetical protein